MEIQVHNGFEKIESQKYQQSKKLFSKVQVPVSNKPAGLWTSSLIPEKPSSDWIDFWFFSERMEPLSNIYGSLFRVDDKASIFEVNSLSDMEDLQKKYKNWNDFSKSYQGIHFSSEAAHAGYDALNLLYGYDVESTCFFTTDILEQVGTFRYDRGKIRVFWNL